MSRENCYGKCQSKSGQREPRFPFFLLKEGEERYCASMGDAGQLIAYANGKIELCYDTKYNVLQSDLSFRPITEEEKRQLDELIKDFSNK